LRGSNCGGEEGEGGEGARISLKRKGKAKVLWKETPNRTSRLRRSAQREEKMHESKTIRKLTKRGEAEGYVRQTSEKSKNKIRKKKEKR